MINALFFSRETFDVGCSVDVQNTFESLHAYVELDGNVPIYPGDEVIVHGAPVEVPYGEHVVLQRKATVRRAGWLERAWTKMTGDIEFMEICEFSFSERATL
ncbi:MAG: hypothetical protein AAGF58_02800 [Pseudomonadota bacterium]